MPSLAHRIKTFSRPPKPKVLVGAFVMAALALGVGAVRAQTNPFARLFSFIPNGVFFPNPSGASQTYSASQHGMDLHGPFFQSLGSNGRTCATCHEPTDGMAVAAANVERRFLLSRGKDPIFRTVDGSNCDHGIDVSTLEGRREAYSLLRTRGVLRIAIPVPANADFRVTDVSNPYGCNETGIISMYRRPLPATNLRFLTSVMIDGRESTPLTGTDKLLYSNFATALPNDLAHQALDAINGHAQASPPFELSDPRIAEIVNFELGLTTAQAYSRHAGLLNAHGAQGGTRALRDQPFFLSINSSVDPLLPGLEPPGGLQAPGDGGYTPAIFGLYGAWDGHADRDPRAAVARGEKLFNSLPINITGVAGINDPASAGGLAPAGIPSLTGTCGTCHNTPNVGNHSFPTPLDIGTGDPDPGNPAVNLGGIDIRYLPRITVCKLDASTHEVTNDCKVTSDLGLALIDGNFDHVGKIKGPILRGLAARAPYFHNGSAMTLLDVVHFYETRFGFVLTPRQEADLVAFLNSL